MIWLILSLFALLYGMIAIPLYFIEEYTKIILNIKNKENTNV